MKKIILGLIQTTFSPIIIIFGYWLISQFNTPPNVEATACGFGIASTVFNFIMGCALIIKGYQDAGTFKGWQ